VRIGPLAARIPGIPCERAPNPSDTRKVRVLTIALCCLADESGIKLVAAGKSWAEKLSQHQGTPEMRFCRFRAVRDPASTVVGPSAPQFHAAVSRCVAVS